MADNLVNIYCNCKNTQLLWYLSHKIWWRRKPGGWDNQTQIGHLELLARHLAPQHTFLLFDIPPKQASRSALISVGSSLPVLPLTPFAWPTYFLIFPCFLRRVMLARCFSHYSVSGSGPSMIALYSLSLIFSLHDSHQHTLSLPEWVRWYQLSQPTNKSPDKLTYTPQERPSLKEVLNTACTIKILALMSIDKALCLNQTGSKNIWPTIWLRTAPFALLSVCGAYEDPQC